MQMFPAANDPGGPATIQCRVTLTTVHLEATCLHTTFTTQKGLLTVEEKQWIAKAVTRCHSEVTHNHEEKK